jgi:hypothetical protein
MYTLILGLIITKAGSTFCSRYGYNYLMFKWKMRNHFKNIKAASEAQYANYQLKTKEGKTAWESMTAEDKAKWDSRNSYSVQEGLIKDNSPDSLVKAPVKKKGCCGGT